MSYPVEDSETNEIITTPSVAQFDVKKFIFRLIGFLPWIIISVLIAYSIATLYLRYTAQVHRVSAQLLIKDDAQSSPDYNIIRELGVMPGSKEIQDQIDILESYALSKAVVDSLHLQFQIVAQGRIASSPLYGKMSPVFIHVIGPDTTLYKPALYKLTVLKDNFSLTPASSTKPVFYTYGDTFLLDDHKIYLTKNDGVKPYSKGYNLIVKDPKSVATAIKTLIDVRTLHQMGGILEISTNDDVPERAVDIINVLIASFNTAGLTDKSIVANKTNQFLKDRVDAVEKELDELEITAGSFKSANKITDISIAGTQYLTETTTYDKARIEQSEEIKMLDDLYSYIKGAKNSADIIPSNNGINEPTLGKLILQYNDAVINYNTQLKISKEKDPLLARLRVDLNNLRGTILKNIESIKIGYQTKLSQIDKQYNNFNDLLASLPEKERVLVKLKRQIGVKEQLYLFLLQKKADAELSLAAVTGDSRVVDSARDQGVILPKANQIKLFSIIIGILLPVVVMMLLEFFNNRIADRKEVEEGTRAPLLGELSYNKKQKNVIVSPNSRSVLSEQFRLIRANLQYLSIGRQPKVILVTSFMSGEGKSFVSLNLAGSLVTGDKRVLLLELDLRKPKLAKYLGIKSPRGLTDYLVNNVALDTVISKVPGHDNIDIITSGPIPPNPTELIMSHKLTELLENAKEKYDYIVIDSPPVGLVADAFIVGQAVDVTLFILRHKYSYKTTIKFIERLYTEKKFNRLCMVMNGIIATSGLGYGYGYGYGYSYGYGYHYGGGYYTEEQGSGIKGWLNNLFKK